MVIDIYTIKLIIISLISLLIGILITWLIMKSRTKKLGESTKTEVEYKTMNMQSTIDEQIQTIFRHQEDKKILENKISDLNSQVISLDKNLAVSMQKATHITVLEVEIINLKDKIEGFTSSNTDLQMNITELETRNEEERKSSEEKLSLLNDAKKELSNQFKVLANEILEEKGKTFSEQNKEKLNIILNPFNEQLKEFRKKVDEVYMSDTRERASLKKELENLQNMNQKLNQEAVNLTRALKGDKKTQGNWGEMILERVLEQSGLKKGREYETQGGYRNEENKLLKPDVIIHLPEKKDIIIDSKVSLIAYEKYSSSDNEEEQLEALAEHILAIKSHIKTLSDKDYSSIKGIRSLDFVVMFIPIESAFMLAFQNDERLFSEAFNKKIIIVTPTTLLVTLKTIENIWRYENQNKNTVAIAERASVIYDKFRGFVEDIEKLGNQLGTVHSTYDAAVNKLSRGKGNLVSQAQRFVELGVKVKREISKTVLEGADVESVDGNEILEIAD